MLLSTAHSHESIGYVCICLMLLFLGACTSATKLSVKDQETIQASYHKKPFFLKHACYVGPFYAYDDRQLISERAFDEKVLIQAPSGEPILPPSPTGTLPMGSKVVIREIEFPTGYALTTRKLMSPRHFTWVMLELQEMPQPRPYLLVITKELKHTQEFRDALRHYLVSEDPRTQFADSPPLEIKAIDGKTLIKGMSAEALLRCRGQPDKRARMYKEGVKLERWQYAPDRIVILKDDRVDRWEGFPPLELEPVLPIEDAQSSSSTSPSFK